MADIELVIKISEEVKNRLCFGITYPKDIQVVCEALNDGITLPKGHGNLIDVSELIPDADYEDGIFGAISCQQIVEAEVPMSEMVKYATDLRSMTQARGSFEMEFSRHDPVPNNIAQKIIADYKASLEEK